MKTTILHSPPSLLAAVLAAFAQLSTLNPQPASAQTTNCVQCPSGLIAWWPGDGSATNLAGSGNGTLQNGATNARGFVGEALSFDGVNDRVAIPESYATDLSRQARWTIQAWVKPTSFTSNSYLTIYSEGYWGIYLGVDNPSGKLESWINNANQLIGTVSVQLSNWNHVARTYDGTNRVFYVNGGFAGSGSAPAVTPDNGGAAIGDVAPTHNAAQFQGLIDEVAIYNRALTSNEIAVIYAAGSNGMCKDALPPTILTSPMNQYVALNSNVTLPVTASGTEPLSYQWLFYGTNITDATNSSFILHPSAFSLVTLRPLYHARDQHLRHGDQSRRCTHRGAPAGHHCATAEPVQAAGLPGDLQCYRHQPHSGELPMGERRHQSPRRHQCQLHHRLHPTQPRRHLRLPCEQPCRRRAQFQRHAQP